MDYGGHLVRGRNLDKTGAPIVNPRSICVYIDLSFGVWVLMVEVGFGIKIVQLELRTPRKRWIRKGGV